MVKAVVGEESRLNSTEDRLSRSAIPSQVGLVIGKLSSSLDRGFVFDLIPTPSNDAGEAACSVLEAKDDRRKPSKSKSQQSDSSSLAIDSDWVAEHARQVSRMLLGGMKVVGIYVWASDSAYKNSTMMLCQTIKAVTGATQHFDPDLDEALLIHICFSPRRWNCRSCLLNSSIIPSNLRPCDFKLGRVLSSLQKFSCNYSFSLRLPMCHEGASTAQTFSEVLRQEISLHVKELRSAKAMIDGSLVYNDEPCPTDGEHVVDLFFPFMKEACTEACSSKDVIGVLLLSGTITSHAYLTLKEPISQAVFDIKADILRSLQSRLDIICDEADENLGPTDDRDQTEADRVTEVPIAKTVLNLSRKSCTLPFPRRVLIPWLADLFICDYLQPFESLEVLKDHCVELMAMETLPDASSILEVEPDAPALISRSFWDAVSPLSSESGFSANNSLLKEKQGTEYRKKSGSSSDPGIMVALLVLLLSIILGVVFYVRA